MLCRNYIAVWFFWGYINVTAYGSRVRIVKLTEILPACTSRWASFFIFWNMGDVCKVQKSLGDATVKNERLVLLIIPLFQGVVVALCDRLLGWKPWFQMSHFSAILSWTCLKNYCCFFLFPSASESALVFRKCRQDSEVLVSRHWGANPNVQGSQTQR